MNLILGLLDFYGLLVALFTVILPLISASFRCHPASMARPVSLYASLSSPISLQLLKFSYATVPMDSAAPVPWTHLSSKDRLVVHLTTVRSRCLDGTVEERAKFRVLQDPEVLVRATRRRILTQIVLTDI